MKAMERDQDGGLMSLISRCSDCSDARWPPRYRDAQLVTVNIKVEQVVQNICRHSGARPCLRRPWHFAVIVGVNFLSHGFVRINPQFCTSDPYQDVSHRIKPRASCKGGFALLQSSGSIAAACTERCSHS